jgi:hypothetical protein
MRNSIKKLLKNAIVWWAVAIFVVTLLPYMQTGHYYFVNIDDGVYVYGPMMRKGLTTDGIKWAFATLNYAAIWMPLTYISYMVDVSLFGVNSGPMHLENAIFHAVDAVLLFLFILMILRRLHANDSQAENRNRLATGNANLMRVGREGTGGTSVCSSARPELVERRASRRLPLPFRFRAKRLSETRNSRAPRRQPITGKSQF